MRWIGRMLLWFSITLLPACDRSERIAIDHQELGGLKVGLLEVEERQSALFPGMKVTPRPGDKFIRLSLHAQGATSEGALEESGVVLAGSEGTKATANTGWGDNRLTTSFRVLEYWFRLPVSETPAYLEIKGGVIDLKVSKNKWPWKFEVQKTSLVDELKTSGVDKTQVLIKAPKGEKMMIIDATFEPLLKPAVSLPPADGGERGNLHIYVDKPGADTSLKLGALKLIGPDIELTIGAVAPVGSEEFFVAKNMNQVAVAGREPRIAVRIATMSDAETLEKVRQLRFGTIAVELPAASR